MMLHIRLWRISALVLAAALLVLTVPVLVAAHSELETSDPPEGATVASPFTGPIVLTFSEHLASGSKADLLRPDGSTVASAKVDAKTMTIALTDALEPGAYQVRWVSIADDGDVLRQPIVKFSVAAAPAPSPTASPTATAVASTAPTAAPSSAPSIPAPSSAPTATPSGTGDAATGTGDVVLPIIVALIVLAAGAFYLLSRRNRPPDAT